MKRKESITNIRIKSIEKHLGAFKYINDDWGTIAFVIPRNQIRSKFVEKELRYNCIYFLLGCEGTQEKAYVGQAKKRNSGESVLARLREHDISLIDKYRNNWDWAIAFTGKDDTWSLDDISALEHAFYHEIPTDSNFNKDNPNSGGANYDLYDDKIHQIKSYISAIGFSIFDNEETNENIQVVSEVYDYNVVEDLHNGLARIPEIVTPRKPIKMMLDLLPLSIWNDKTVFLDPACKGGEFVRAIYDRLMECEILEAKFPDMVERSNYILKNQIYAIALSQVSLERTAKKLKGYDNNIRVIKDYIGLLKGMKSGINIKQIISKEFGHEMKIDIVIGNPPYQESTGGGIGNSGVSIYPLFINLGIELAEQTCMIVPARWMSDRPNGVDIDTLHRLRTRTDIRNLIDFKDKTVFNGVNIAGGVCIIHIDKEFKGERLDTNGVIIRDEVYRSIINKVVNKDFVALSNFITSDCFRSGSHMNSGWDGFSILEDDTFNIKYYCSDRDCELGFGYVNEDDIIKSHSVVKQYKVALKSVSPIDGKVIYKGFVMEPNSCCSRTYIVVHGDELITSKNDCENILKYLSTKFARACIKSIKNTQNASSQAYKFVPVQNFRDKSDIDWSISVKEIDSQLYEKYGLTKEEIDYIEKTIKPLD